MIVEHMEASLRRGKSRYSVDTLLGYLRAGKLGIAIGGAMTGSWVRFDGHAEVGHLAGAWDDADARWIVDAMKDDLEAHGIPRDGFHWTGRPGWRRFLAMRGFVP